MSRSSQLQHAAKTVLSGPGALRVPVPTITLKPKELIGDIEKASAQGGGLCITIFPVLPTRVEDETPFVFVKEGQMIVRVMEKPAVNNLGANAWQIAEDIARALHWQPSAPNTPFSALLAHPLQLAPSTFLSAEDKVFRMVDVIFNATYQLPQRTLADFSFLVDQGASAAENIQCLLQARLTTAMENPVPVTILRDHDLASAVANAGQVLSVQIQPLRPASAMQGEPSVFFERWEVRVKVIENVPLNASDVNAYDVVEDVMSTLHWTIVPGLLSYPLQLQPSPTRFDENEKQRTIEVNFSATMGFTPLE